MRRDNIKNEYELSRNMNWLICCALAWLLCGCVFEPWSGK